MVARLQQAITLGLLLAAIVWWCLFWPVHPWAAGGGALLILLGYAVILGIEFILLAAFRGADPTPRASAWQLVQAWCGEVFAMPRVFFWRQPFRALAEPDFLPSASSGRGVVLVHGLFCNRGFWNPWLRELRAQHRACVAVNLAPAWGSLDAHTATVEQAVRQVHEATGQAPILVCHSMGGLVVRAWLHAAQAHARVHRVVTIGSPHGGTWMARLSRTVHGAQMGLHSRWLERLQAGEAAQGYGQFVCWYSNADNIVFPPATGSLRGADNRLVPATAHVALGFHPQVMQATLALA